MLSFLFFFVTSSTKEHYKCSVNIDGNFYNFTDIASKDRIVADDNNNEWRYWVKYCGELTRDEYPPTAQYNYGVSAIRCSIKDLSNCQIIGYYSTQDYEYASTVVTPEDGAVITQKAQYYGTEDGFNLFKLSQVFHCDESSDSMEIKGFKTLMYNGLLNVVFEYKNKYGCPVKNYPVPTPEPNVQNECKFSSYSQTVYPYMIDIDLHKFNYAKPYGMPYQINSSSFALINPCGISNCPPNKQCNADSSSIWVCKEDGNCVSYGNAGNFIEISQRLSTPDEGIIVSYDSTDTDGLSYMVITCDYDIFSDSSESSIIRIDKMEFDENKIAKIAASANEACMKPPESTPNPEICTTEFEYKGETKTIQLKSYNKLGGIVNKINLSPHQPEYEYSLHLQTCGGLNCPGAKCDLPNGATVWLCKKHPYQPVECDPYGTFAENFTVGTNESSIENGLIIHYQSKTGKHKLSSDLSIQCDWLMDDSQLRIENDVKLVNWNNLKIQGYSKDVCVGETPYHPILPIPTVMPTPGPEPNHYITRTKGDEKVEFDVSDMFDNSSNIYYVTINDGGNNINGIFQYNPFYPKKCPDNNVCEITKASDGWICFLSHCYPIANHDYPMEILDTPALTKTSYIIEGYSNYKTQMNIECSQDTKMVIDTYIENQDGKFVVNAKGLFACPVKIPTPTQNPEPTQEPPTPTQNPEPTPIPHSSKGSSKGIIFLGLLLLILILYILIGVLYKFILTGNIEIPNEGFWIEFGECIKAGFMYITCQNKGKDLSQPLVN